jgi:hypothetical protein
MDNTLLEREQSILDMQAWRGVFKEGVEAGDGEAIVIMEPRDITAVLTPVDAKGLIGSTSRLGPDAFEIVWMPSPAGDLPNAECEAEAWFNRAATPRRRSIVRAGTRTARVFWCEGRALIYCKAPQLHDTLDGVVRFALTERETVRLERGMKTVWAAIDEDKSLTHAVTPGQQKQQKHVNKMTELVVQMKSGQMRIETALEQLDPTLAEPSKRLYGELAIAAGLYDRAPRLGDPVQFASDHYELANTRLIEAKNATAERTNFLIGHILESLIIVLLLAELTALLYEIQLFYDVSVVVPT